MSKVQKVKGYVRLEIQLLMLKITNFRYNKTKKTKIERNLLQSDEDLNALVTVTKSYLFLSNAPDSLLCENSYSH